MSRPPVQLERIAVIFFLLACLAFLAGCQGVSAGSSVTYPTGTLSMASSTVSFGNVAAGTTKTLTVNATNSGTASLTISSVAISSKYFALQSPSIPVTVAVGQTVPVSVTFSPNAAGSFSATATITSDASNTATNVTLTGTGTSSTPGQLALNPASEDFGSVTVGSQKSQTVTLTNTGGSTVNISQASVSGTGFQLSGLTTPLALNPSQNTTFTVVFAPQATGSASGTVTISSDASNSTLTMALSGTAVSAGTLGANPTSLSFGSVTVGSNQSLTEKLTNNGGATVTISQVAISGTGFTLSGVSTPITLTSGQSTSFSVTFAPAAAGSASGDVTVTSNGSNPTLTIPLSGTGISAGDLTPSPASLSFGSVTVGSNQ